MTDHSPAQGEDDAPATVAPAQPPADPYRNLKSLFADRGLVVVRVTEDVD